MVTSAQVNPKAKVYDSLRARVPFVQRPDMFVQTAGVAALPADFQEEVWRTVRDFKAFNEDNDPWGEHDCAIFDCRGQRFMFKIDDYNGQEGYRHVLTVLFADEY
jgi:hypothetical protein